MINPAATDRANACLSSPGIRRADMYDSPLRIHAFPDPQRDSKHERGLESSAPPDGRPLAPHIATRRTNLPVAAWRASVPPQPVGGERAGVALRSDLMHVQVDPKHQPS